MSVDDEIKAIVAPLQAQHKKLSDQRATARQQLDLIEDELRRVEKVLRAADPTFFAKATPNGKNVSGRTVSEVAINRVHAAMWAEPHIEWTIPALAKKLGMSVATVDSAMTELRARGITRPLGRRPSSTGHGAVMAFKVGENVPPPTTEPEKKTKQTGGIRISPARVERLMEVIRSHDGETFTMRDVLPEAGIPNGSQTLAMNTLLEDGLIERIYEGKAGRRSVFKVTSNGS